MSMAFGRRASGRRSMCVAQVDDFFPVGNAVVAGLDVALD